MRDKKRERASDEIQKYDKINKILSEFDCFSPYQQISSLCVEIVLEDMFSCFIYLLKDYFAILRKMADGLFVYYPSLDFVMELYVGL